MNNIIRPLNSACNMEFSTRDVNSAVDHAMKRAGLKELKKEQRKAIHDFVSGRDVFVSLPTGYGKSFCYALLPVVFDHPSLENRNVNRYLHIATDCPDDGT